MNTKLSPSIVRRIRRAWNAKGHPHTLSSLAAKYHVAVPTVSHVVYGITWKEVQ